MNDIKDITPLGQRVLVHFGEKEKVSAGGLILAESAQDLKYARLLKSVQVLQIKPLQ